MEPSPTRKADEVRRLKRRDDLRQENELPRDRISRLTAAILRISESLDLGTVLREVVDGARALTGARFGGVVTLGESDQALEFVTSGITAAEHQRVAEWPNGLRLFEHFRDLPGPLRLRDFPGYVRSLGHSQGPIPSQTFQCTPMRHRGLHVGYFFLGEKEGGREFTGEDEEVLVLFGAQAATAIANARTHRDEQRARADLEALVDTSPVGIIIFDARNGKPASHNREAKRIVRSLGQPGRDPEQLLESLTFRRADGREISLEELSLVQALSSGETVRAEEIVLEVPDGRSITTLINATPIHSADGTLESMVVTLQDLAPLEELERMRADFLGLVSHELRVPLTSIKGSAATALGTSPAPNLVAIRQFLRIIDEQADHMQGLINDLLDAGSIEAGTLSVAPEAIEVASVVDQARSTFLSGGGRHTVRIDLPPDLPRVEADRQRIVQVLNNLFSNAARNAPQSTPIEVAAVNDGVYVAISVADEGRGVAPELLPHLFRKHTRVAGRGIGGSGLGLAICKGLVEAHGGRIRAESGGPGLGTRFTFTIPVADESARSASADSARSSSRLPVEGLEKPRILVVEDDPQTLGYVRDALTAGGYDPLLTGEPDQVSHLVRTKQPQLVLLDLVLPGTDGIELMQRVPELAELPVIFISGYGGDETVVRALDAGATDYIVKPFSPTELVARVRAALRKRYKPPESFRLGALTIDYEGRRVTLAGRPVPLTATEYELLRVLSVNAGRVTTYATLLHQVWGRDESGDHRPVRAFVKLLRRKLSDDAASPAYIFTERRVGYRMPRPNDP